jgi:hypothetical protein
LTYTDNNFVDVFQNGVLLKGGGTDYTATSGTSVVLTTGASVSDVIEIIVYDVFSVGNFFNRTDSDSRYVNVDGDTMTGSLDLNGTELVLDVDGDTSITADTDDQIDFKTGGADRLIIDSSGRVGIGITPDTTSAGKSLQINRSVINDDDGGSTGFLHITQNGYYDSAWKYVEDGAAEKISFNQGTIVFENADSNSSGADASLTWNQRFKMDAGGRLDVGSIGHTSDNMIDVASPNLSAVAGGVSVQNLTDNTGGYLVSFYRSNNALIGTISQGSGSVAYNTSSDYRLKENVKTDWDATTRLKQLKPSRFNFKDYKDTTVDGFLAHEVSSIVPEAVTGEKDAVDKEGNPEYQGIDQSKLVPLLTKALQESIARADALEARIKKLEDG